MTTPRSGAPLDPKRLGLPEHSALTVEGHIERAGGVGTHLTRRRDGRERSLWSSNWAMGLFLLLAALVGVVVIAVIANALTSA